MTEYLDVDVRPILRTGGEPFSTIMAAVASVRPVQGTRLYSPFKLVPLFDVMASKGFAHSASEIGGGDRQVLFTPLTRQQLRGRSATNGLGRRSGSTPGSLIRLSPWSGSWPQPNNLAPAKRSRH